MSLKDQGENKAVEPTVPETYQREYTKFCRAMESETDPETLGVLQVKFRMLLMHMSTLKVPVLPEWSDAHNACGDKMNRLRMEEFRRRYS